MQPLGPAARGACVLQAGVSRSAASAPAQHNIALRKVAPLALPSPSRVRVTECYVGRPGLRGRLRVKRAPGYLPGAATDRGPGQERRMFGAANKKGLIALEGRIDARQTTITLDPSLAAKPQKASLAESLRVAKNARLGKNSAMTEVCLRFARATP